MARSRGVFSFIFTTALLALFFIEQAWASERALPRSEASEERITFAFAKILAEVDLDFVTRASYLPSFGYIAGSAQMRPGAVVVREHAGVGMSAGDELADDLDNYTDESSPKVSDPFEGWNRFWFRFNDKFYLYVAEPMYRGWEAITPAGVRWGLKNFFHNVLFPVRFLNNLLQLKFKAAGVEFSRFMMNTMCSAGFSNPASEKKTIVPVDPAGEDLGQTLGVWGIGHGPYIVWPLIGPSSLRDTFGRVGDLFAAPFFYLQPWWVSSASALTLRFNDLDEVLPLYRELKGAALDPYIAMREAYINYRNQHLLK